MTGDSRELLTVSISLYNISMHSDFLETRSNITFMVLSDDLCKNYNKINNIFIYVSYIRICIYIYICIYI